jgi:arsenite methyltransferase
MSALSLALDTPDLADHYERVSADRQFRAGQLLIEKLRVHTGEHVLDVGTGTGLVAEYTASLVGPTGSVVGIDPLALRIEIAKRKAKSRVQKNLSFRVGDAKALGDFADASLDVVYLNAVFHWLPEKLGPLREFFRVLKPGGRLGISTGERGRNSLRALRKQVLSRPEYSAHVDSADDVGHNVSADELRQLLTQTGFTIERLDVLTHASYHATASAAIEFAQASSFGNFLGRLPQSLRQSAREELERELEQQRTPQGIPQQGSRIVVIAKKP